MEAFYEISEFLVTLIECYKSFFSYFHVLNYYQIDLTSPSKGWQALGHDLKVRSNLPEKQLFHFPLRLDRYLVRFKPYLLLFLIHPSLLLLNYSELNFILLTFSHTNDQVAFPLSLKHHLLT